MTMRYPWIKLYKKTIDSTVFDNPKVLKVWIWCLLRASHDGDDEMVGYKPIHLQSGEFIFGRLVASEELKMPQSTVRNCIASLVKLGKLDIKSSSKFSIITIKRWVLYQSDGQQMENKRKTNENKKATIDKIDKIDEIDENRAIGEKNVDNFGSVQVNRGVESFGEVIKRRYGTKK